MIVVDGYGYTDFIIDNLRLIFGGKTATKRRAMCSFAKKTVHGYTGNPVCRSRRIHNDYKNQGSTGTRVYAGEIFVNKGKKFMKVCKFGGSSLCNAEQFQKVRKIIKSDPFRRYVVVSAPGKRFTEDQKITDALYECYETASNAKNTELIFSRICDRYDKIIKDLGLKLSLEDAYKTILRHLHTGVNCDYIVSRGEYLCGRIMAAYLEYDFVDAAELIVFNGDGSLNAEKTNSRIGEVLKNHYHAVIPGFYGIGENQKIVTFSRGGSDITGALIAKGVCADIYENWTDVPGVLTASPSLIPNADKVDFMRYSELFQLSRLGADVFHTDAIAPLKEAGIPTSIRNTNSPDQSGTMICKEIPESLKSQPLFCGLAAEIGDGTSTEKVLLHLVGCQLSLILSDVLCALRKAGIDPLFMEDRTNDWVFGIKRQQITEASVAVYTSLVKNRNRRSINEQTKAK